MSRAGPDVGEFGFDTFGTACGLAVVTGALALLTPTFNVLTATLVALALAGWASRHRTRAEGPRGGAVFVAPYVLSFGVLAAAVALFLDPRGTLGPCRGLLLGVALVPLWVTERRQRDRRRPEGVGG